MLVDHRIVHQEHDLPVLVLGLVPQTAKQVVHEVLKEHRVDRPFDDLGRFDLLLRNRCYYRHRELLPFQP